MSESVKRTITWSSVLPALVIPVCLGLVLYILLKAAIHHLWITDETVLRYLIGHWVSEVSVAMFFVGLVSLLMISWDILRQIRSAERIGLDDGTTSAGLIDVQADGESSGDRAATLARKLFQSHSNCEGHYLYQRLAAALKSIHQNETAAQIEEELKYLSELDVEQQQQRYSLVQILIWATPMLGFLGTVLGISQALGGISVGPDNDFQQMMDGLKASLYVAFDTTALALCLSMVLMFGQFLVERFESQLLRIVDNRSHAEISTQFDLSEEASQDSRNQLETKLIATMEAATERQTAVWRDSLQWAGSAVTQAIRDSQNKFESSLEKTLDNSLQGLALNLGEAILRADQSMSHRWEQWQVMLSENARNVSKNQTAFVEQTQAVCQMLEQTARQTSQSTKEISEQFYTQTKEISDQFHLQTKEVNGHLEAVSKALRSDTFVAQLSEFFAAQMSSAKLSSDGFDNGARNGISPDTIFEGQWVSVSPTFLTGEQDSEQVILPFPSIVNRDSKSNGGKRSKGAGQLSDPGPEVILPFLKKSA
jgi:biopolymer transport protein ExbB/TolQ